MNIVPIVKIMSSTSSIVSEICHQVVNCITHLTLNIKIFNAVQLANFIADVLPGMCLHQLTCLCLFS